MNSDNPHQTSTCAERILVRGVNWLGDAVMSTPALLRLREARPHADITLLTHEKLRDLWAGHPAINRVETFATGESVWSVGRRLRAGRFDIGLTLPNSPRSALELWLAGIPQRVGYARPWRNWFLTQRVEPRAGTVPMHKRSTEEIKRLISGPVPARASPPANAHHIYQYLHLTAALGANPEPLAPRLVVSDEQVARFVADFHLGISDCTPWFGLNAGAEYGPAKRWPEDRFIAAAIEIQRRTRCQWLVFGIKSENELTERIATNINRAAETSKGVSNPAAINLAGATTLAQLCAGLKACRVLLTNDSGPMHLAAALGTPVVALFGSTSPELTGPGLPGESRNILLRADAPCAPCFLRECPIDFRCMTGISVERAVAAVMQAAGSGSV